MKVCRFLVMEVLERSLSEESEGEKNHKSEGGF